ncbi:TniQ family protein [Methylobacterium sp.]|uniref:TniQ family protein n=1 Tax=Methylobacterium sp. TaxID=409 RepID=UPI003B013636
MPRLYPFLPLGDGESLTSFTSRLSVLHSFAPVRGFLHYLGLNFSALASGDPGAIEKLAELTNVSTEALQTNAIRRNGEAFTFRGQTMLRSMMRRSRYFACPACIAEDIAASKLAPECAVYGRAFWQFAPIRACPTHGIALQPIGEARLPSEFHDFARGVRPALDHLDRLVGQAVSIEPSRAQAYLIGRFEGHTRAPLWLDNLAWHVAARVCEMLGAVSIFGPTVPLRTLTDADWHRAGDVGFGIAQSGEAGVRAFLSDLQATNPSSWNAVDGAQAMFGRLYQWLAFGAPHADFDPIRDVMFRHIVETTPIAPGETLFGRRVEYRSVHSIRTASQDTGRHPKTLRKILLAQGVIDRDDDGSLDHHVRFDAAQTQALLAHHEDAVSIKGLETYLNTGRVQAKILVKHGFIEPLHSHSSAQRQRPTFSTADLDHFLYMLTDRAVPATNPAPPIVNIPGAAKRANCGAHEVIRLILDRKLGWVGQDEAVPGYLGILVNADEVKRFVHGKTLDGLTARAIEKRLKTSTKVVTGLIEKGYLPTQTCINPINRCPVQIVENAVVDAFDRKYILLAEMANIFETIPVVMMRRLEDAGIKPAITRIEVGATFYLRERIQ